MEDILEQTLFVKNREAFGRIREIAEKFCNQYKTGKIVGEGIFDVLAEYAKANELKLEILEYNFKDDELWAFTFLKKGTVFVCVNSSLELGKCFFALAHELYHIYCYIENSSKSYIKNGSLQTEDANVDKEDMEANAFAGVFLLADSALEEYRNHSVDEKLIFEIMETFLLPYKAVVLRLYEHGIINREECTHLLQEGTEEIKRYIETTGQISKSLQIRNRVSLGSLQKNYTIALQKELVKESRLEQDALYIKEIMKKVQ